MSAAAARRAAADVATMRHALALGRRGLGNTWPNPAVGAVIWRDTPDGPLVVGRGWTMPGGRPHAETVAIAQAGAAARGATISVTLEPCSHVGKTPPCSHAIVEAGLARVVSALEDPDPRVNGRGHIHLRAHGVEVSVGVLAAEARAAHLGFIRKVVDRRPMVTLKLARTADGQAGRRSGARLLITGERTQARVHMMRAQHDVIVVGIGTVLADDPQLTCRLPGLEARSPVRVVLDRDLRTPLASALVRGARTVPLWILCGPDAAEGDEAALTDAGAAVERVALGADGRLDLRAALAALAARGVTRAFCEGGPHLAEALAAAGLVDRIVLLTGPDPLGGDGIPALGPALAAMTGGEGEFGLADEVGLEADRMALFTRRR